MIPLGIVNSVTITDCTLSQDCQANCSPFSLKCNKNKNTYLGKRIPRVQCCCTGWNSRTVGQRGPSQVTCSHYPGHFCHYLPLGRLEVRRESGREGSIHWAQLPLFPLARLSVVLLCEEGVSVYAALDACFSVLSCEGLHGKRLYQDSHSQSNTITGVQGDWWSPTDLSITAKYQFKQ